jgi:hypothetical protein
MEGKLSHSVTLDLTDTVYSDSVSLYVKNKTIVTILGFIFISLLLHTFILYFFKFQQRDGFDNNSVDLKVTLQTKEVDKVQLPSPSLPEAKGKTKVPVEATQTPLPIHVYELLKQSKQVIEQQIQLQLQRSKLYQFGESHLDERTLTPDWLKSGEGNNLGDFSIEDFQLADGGTFVKLTFSNGRTMCYEVRPADPSDVFSMAIWVVNRCKG